MKQEFAPAVDLESLRTYPGNARRGDVEVIRESLRTNAQFAPLVVQKSTGYVLAGNHTLEAMRAEGWEQADVYLVDVGDEEARRIVLAANRTADLASYDDSALLALIESVGDVDALLGTGYTDSDIIDLRAFVALTEGAMNFSQSPAAEDHADGQPEVGHVQIIPGQTVVNVVVRKEDEARLYAALSTLDFVLDARQSFRK